MMNPEEIRKASKDLKRLYEIKGNKNTEQGSSSSVIVPLDHPDLRRMDDEDMKDFPRSRGKSNRLVCNMKTKRLFLVVNAIIEQEKRSGKRIDQRVYPFNCPNASHTKTEKGAKRRSTQSCSSSKIYLAKESDSEL